MPFPDYTELVEPLALPYQGRVYVIPPVGIADTIRLNLVFDPDSTEQLPEDEVERLVLGTAQDELRGDNVPAEFFARVFATALSQFRYGRERAEMFWATGGDPKAIETWAASRAADSTPSTSTGGENATPSRASTRATTSRRKPTPTPQEAPASE